MVALALSVLALSSGIAAGETMTSGSAFAPLVPACGTPSNPALALTLLSGAQLRDAEETTQGFEGLSFEITDIPTRQTMEFGMPVTFSEAPEPLELLFSAPTKFFDVGVAQRTVSAEYRGAYVTGQGAEVRIGQGLKLMQSSDGIARRNGWYFFAASDGRQLSWTPSSDPSSPTRSLRLDNGVEIGDMQVGLAAQHGAMQTSLSVVKRTVKSYVGPFKSSADASFAGITLAYRH
jgi:hypothetical protein